jgi:hypothetical protein
MKRASTAALFFVIATVGLLSLAPRASAYDNNPQDPRPPKPKPTATATATGAGTGTAKPPPPPKCTRCSR